MSLLTQMGTPPDYQAPDSIARNLSVVNNGPLGGEVISRNYTRGEYIAQGPPNPAGAQIERYAGLSKLMEVDMPLMSGDITGPVGHQVVPFDGGYIGGNVEVLEFVDGPVGRTVSRNPATPAGAVPTNSEMAGTYESAMLAWLSE